MFGIDSTNKISPVLISYPSQSNQWVKTWDRLPKQGTITPVWDGDYLYFALCDQEGKAVYWIITSQEGINLSDVHLRRKTGEEVFPIYWMEILPPKK